jgi:hypothetical protein
MRVLRPWDIFTDGQPALVIKALMATPARLVRLDRSISR